MKKSSLYLLIAVIITALICVSGCTKTNDPIQTTAINHSIITPTELPTKEIPLITPMNNPSPEEIQSQNQVDVCDEWVSCGQFGNGNHLDYTPSQARCQELYDLRMHNDQTIIQCITNTYEVRGDKARVVLQCNQGIGTVDDCAKIGVVLDRDNGNVIKHNYSVLLDG